MHDNDSAKTALLNVAKKLFASKGFHATTVREIADAAKVNLGLVSYYFQGKEGLYKTCIEQFGSARLEDISRILSVPSTVEDVRVRLELLVQDIFASFIKEPDLIKMIHHECDSDVPMISDIYDRTLKQILLTLVSFFESAQSQNLIHKDVDCYNASINFIGAIVHQIRTDNLSKKYFNLTVKDESYRNKFVKQLVQTTLWGLVRKEN